VAAEIAGNVVNIEYSNVLATCRLGRKRVEVGNSKRLLETIRTHYKPQFRLSKCKKNKKSCIFDIFSVSLYLKMKGLNK
jgi:hypothetical protein